MADLRDEIAAYDAMRADLEANSLGRWSLVHDRTLIGTYDSFDDAAKEAAHRSGRGPYLIHQIGAPLPASVMYRYASQLRLTGFGPEHLCKRITLS
jgi:hypothetical protein